MSEQVFDIHGQQYTVSLIKDWQTNYSSPAFQVKILETNYVIIERNEKYELNRCPDSLCEGIASDFVSLKTTLEFADIYERMIGFTFLSDESKEEAITKLIGGINYMKGCDLIKSDR